MSQVLTRSNQDFSDLEDCCRSVVELAKSMDLWQDADEWLCHPANCAKLVEMVRHTWIEDKGGNPMNWPWNDAFVVMTCERIGNE